MIATDLDGTLLGSAGRVSAGNLDALHRLGAHGVVRVVATGRSAFSARRVLTRETPIDYLVVSSGAGIIDWRTGEYLRASNLTQPQTADAAHVLAELGLDFMVHHPIPDNHRFVFRRAAGCPDFERRIALYREHCTEGRGPWTQSACQLLAVHDSARIMADDVARRLPAFTVLRATSPLDRRSVWIEVFPQAVSKSQACAWIAERHALDFQATIAIGNDTNDLDLLRWAGRAFVVADAHETLLPEFVAVAAVDDDGFADVAALTLTDL
jgi:hypothetical protein